MKYMRICFYSAVVISIFLCSVRTEAGVSPQRIPQLDSLASDISFLGYIPSGGRFTILAAYNNWFGLLTSVRLLPGDSDEMAALLMDTSGKYRYYGAAPWTPDGDMVLVTAPQYICLPSNLQPAVAVGSQAFFFIDGYELLSEPQTAIGTPNLEVFEICPDSAGRFLFNTPLKGVYWVEVMQQTSSGPSIELLFPIIAGGTAADVFNGTMRITGSEADSPSEVFRELNSIRHSKGIQILQPSGTLDSLASIRAENLAFSGSFSHFGLNTGSLPEILSQSISVYGENIGRGRGYQEAWSMILISPFHLQTCMAEAYTHMGISGAVETSEYEWQLVLVQVFASGVNE
ncbi:MAG: hypothetical protein K8S15_01740 [Candidatus Aegiribacteria sp.]|nr:hypothetical protein [Candidatus Aegiribacteria sp.]